MKISARLRGTVVLAAAAMTMACPALATEGYFALGYGPVQRSQGGAGVANGTDAMATAMNPAGVATVGNEFSLGLQVFSPSREYTGTGTGFIAPGTVKSDWPNFLVPNLAWNKVLANGARLNIAAYGNGGMNTSYPAITNTGPGCPGATGIFCGGKAGVNLSQLFLSVTYAQKIGNISFGIAPTFALQGFSANGLAAFGKYSSDATRLSDTGTDWSHGFGLRAGMVADIAPGLRWGLSGQTKFSMSRFGKYSGLFADGGKFDIPAAVTTGLAWDARQDLTLMLDYERIFYSGVPAVSNPFNGLPLGAAGGPGFGWKDVDVIKLGAAWRSSPVMTWRAGYAYATNPVQSSQVTLNILAPGVVRHHFTFGGSYQMDARDTLDFAVEYVPTSSVSGPVPSAFGGGTVKLSMSQFAASVGWTRKF
ncbi:MAG: outer membrane protein transport protein [Paracoccaceae bacterium]|nr:outer membrane protein transport protein [Paracoccaceae bacterium]